MGTIFYKIGDKIYVNVTNKCPCDCTFCIRGFGDSVGEDFSGNAVKSLWLEREPDLAEIKSGFDAIDLDGFTEIVFCGYGEPTERAEVVAEIGEYINSRTDIPLRLNTNGLVKLINPEFDISRFRVFDCISISLNADNRVNYQKLTRSKFGEISFDSMLEFAEKMREFTKVFFTVVDTPDFKVDVKKCEKVSRECKVELRVRKFGM